MPFDFNLLNEALSLVNAAVRLDKSQNYLGAIDYYDMVNIFYIFITKTSSCFYTLFKAN